MRRSKRIRSEKYDLTFDSKWELAVFEHCKDRGLAVVYCPDIKIPYESNGVKHIYQPDFLIEGRLYEVKGDQFFRKDGTMFCPYRKKGQTDEEYRLICDIYEAKHQCMLANGVRILRSADMGKLESAIIGRRK